MNKQCSYYSKDLESDNNTNFCNEDCENDFLYEKITEDDDAYGELK